MRRTTTVLSLAAAGALLAACTTGGGDDPTTEPTDEPTTTESPSEPTDEPTSAEPTDEPTDEPSTGIDDPSGDEPPFPDGTDQQSAEPAGEADLVLTDVRVGEHDGFDRVVLEFSGTGTPGWTVGYVEEAVRDGSGEVVPLGGDVVLDVVASGTTYPESEADYYDGPRQFEPEDGGDVEDVYVDGTFEGLTHVMVGLDGEAVPFRVFALAEPSRLVVDVQDLED